jgi:hypothetical protein
LADEDARPALALIHRKKKGGRKRLASVPFPANPASGVALLLKACKDFIRTV